MHEEAIYLALSQIPKGKVVTYGQLGQLAGVTNGARAVGRALRNLPSSTSLPWHRVVNSKRTLSFEFNSDAYNRQKALLNKEGIIFEKERILTSYFIDTLF